MRLIESMREKLMVIDRVRARHVNMEL